MYSIVLATVLTAGGETPNWGFGRGWHGCHRCHCGWCGCRGWYGGGGCWCGCGCGWGCHCGWCGCSWGCRCGGWCGGCVVISSCGCVSYGGAGTSGGGAYAQPTADPRLIPQTESERDAVRKVLEKLRTKKSTTAPAPSADVARVTVRLPAEASLYVDGTLCPLTSDTRSFNTPALEPGRQYYYTMRMDLNRDGQSISETRRVIVAAGQRVDVTFPGTAAAATAQR